LIFCFLDFALVAAINEKDKNETEDDGKSKERKKITRGNVMQAMRQKCNQLIFQTKRPTYHKGENFYLLCVMSIKKILVTKLQCGCHYRHNMYM